MTRVIMHGCNGHMGQVITKLAEEDTDVEIVAGVDPFDTTVIRFFHLLKNVTLMQT